MDARAKTVERLRSLLNAPDVLPESAYRRNGPVYELVCYVNCLIGAELSGRPDVVELFGKRIAQFIANHPPSAEWEAYYRRILDYCSAVERADLEPKM